MPMNDSTFSKRAPPWCTQSGSSDQYITSGSPCRTLIIQSQFSAAPSA